MSRLSRGDVRLRRRWVPARDAVPPRGGPGGGVWGGSAGRWRAGVVASGLGRRDGGRRMRGHGDEGVCVAKMGPLVCTRAYV